MATPHTRILHEFPESTRVARAWYIPEEKVIEVEFLRDSVRWMFSNCEEATWRRFTSAGSPGRYLREVLERHPNRRRGSR